MKLINNSKLVMLPGYPFYPAEMNDIISKAGLVHPMDQQLLLAASESIANLRKLLGVKKPYQPFIFNSTSMFMLEMAFSNLLEESDVVLVLGNRSTSNRIRSLLGRHCGAIDQLDYAEDGKLNLELLAGKLEEKPYKLVIAPHADHQGIINDVELIGKAVKDKGAFFAVDCTSTIGAHEIDQDGVRADLVVFSSNWGLAGPSGLSFASVSESFMEENKRLADKKTKKIAECFDLQYWRPLMAAYENIEKAQINEQLPAPLVIGTNYSLKKILADLSTYRKNHESFKANLCDILMACNLEITNFNNSNSFINTFTTFRIPEKIKPDDFFKALTKQKLVLGKEDSEVNEVKIGHVGFLDQELLLPFAIRLEKALKQVDHEFTESEGIMIAIDKITKNAK
ncbi:MAG: aminotransferase class V-fold PLP-dependent enzyme [Candidatus Odinarchaeota archaeon]